MCSSDLAQRYGEAVVRITDFLNRYRQVTAYVDTEIRALQLEMHALELDISSIDSEKSAAEKTIRDFEIQYNRTLGHLLLDILAIRKQIAQKQAEANPDDPETKKRQSETEEDFESYHSSYQATKSKPLSTLTANEKTLLKDRYRAAVKLCHPDVVAEAFKAASQLAFIELQTAYETNDLARVSAILNNLRDGKPFDAAHTALNEKNQLRHAIEQLRQRREQLISALQNLKQNNTFVLIQNISDWQLYFDNQKVALDERLAKLMNAWKRINL